MFLLVFVSFRFVSLCFVSFHYFSFRYFSFHFVSLTVLTVFRALEKSDADARKEMAGNVVLTGAGSLFDGMPERITSELTESLPSAFKVFDSVLSASRFFFFFSGLRAKRARKASAPLSNMRVLCVCVCVCVCVYLLNCT